MEMVRWSNGNTLAWRAD